MSRKRTGNGHDRKRPPTFGEESSQFFQGPVHPHFGGGLCCAESGGDFFEASAFKESKHQGVLFTLPELSHGRLQQGLHIAPKVRLIFVQLRSHIGFLFAVLSAAAQGQSFGGRVSRGPVKPAGNRGLGSERTCLTRQNDEDRLGNLLRQVRVPNLAQGNRIDQIDMPRYQRGKSLLSFAPCILPHEVHVIDHHSIYTSTQTRKSNNTFPPGERSHPNWIPLP